MFSWHGIGQQQCSGGEGHVPVFISDLGYKSAIRATYIPNGIINIATNIWAQYVCFTGAVANKMGPMQKATSEIIIRILPGTLVNIKPVVRAAANPVIAAGTNSAVARRGDIPRSCSTNCQEKYTQMPNAAQPQATQAKINPTSDVMEARGTKGNFARFSTCAKRPRQRSPTINRT
jgi:hypothetical protein